MDEIDARSQTSVLEGGLDVIRSSKDNICCSVVKQP